MKSVRTLTVGRSTYNPEVDGYIPMIRLQGAWLAALGFVPGKKITVEIYQRGELSGDNEVELILRLSKFQISDCGFQI